MLRGTLMPNTIDRVATEGGTAIPNHGSTEHEKLKVSGDSNEAQFIRIVETITGDSLGVSTGPIDGHFSIDINVVRGRAYKIVADNRGGGAPSNEWNFRVTHP